ncbi:hypothetical protein HX13_03655 [Chryseobacterium sp. P1-3]|uniref:lantibiotic dehydratase n=1 Tax=Chryseobacterium sp. (strain P1-3) TaxID=1517683 RepID=UPI0004E63144|nr:lantibiotic dehydratase [Chryseobacterium sp. P1-3]KFF75329.1 hypothetical protein HX13_03655 [Chryseobacterium sp. P1-3]
MSRFPYQFFDEYVFRTPLFSRKDFQEITGKDEILNTELKTIYSDPIFQEAIYLASPYLHGELNKWLSSEKELLLHKNQKLKNSLLKYYSRMSTRSIPFGLFTEVGLGKFGSSGSFLKKDELISNNLIRDTKLDMHFLFSLSGHFVKTPKIRNRLLFYPQ